MNGQEHLLNLSLKSSTLHHPWCLATLFESWKSAWFQPLIHLFLLDSNLSHEVGYIISHNQDANLAPYFIARLTEIYWPHLKDIIWTGQLYYYAYKKLLTKVMKLWNRTFTPKNFSMYLMLILPTLKCNSPYIKLLHIENFSPLLLFPLKL